jgi:MFS transporter, DHA3 family, macrolide efflux protein
VVGPGGTGLGAYGLVMAAYGVGNLLANLIVGNRPLPRHLPPLIFGGNLLLGTGVVLLAIASALLPDAELFPALAAAAALAAVGGPMQDIPNATMRQTLLAPDEIAAAVRAYMIVVFGGLLLATLAAPMLFTIFGASAVVAACGATYLIIGLAGLVLFAAPAASRRRTARAEVDDQPTHP